MVILQGGVMLWQSLVRTILEYSCVIWGKEFWPEGEQVQADMAKKILKCSGMSKREAVLGDLGWWTLQGRRNFIKLKYWFHIHTLDQSCLVKRVYLVSRSEAKPSSWAKTIHKLLVLYGLVRFWDNPDLLFNIDGKGNGGANLVTQHKSFWKNYLFKIILQHEEKMWWKRMNTKQDNNKLRTYMTFKKKLRMEKYLLAYSNSKGRTFHTSLRNGTNQLEIERGRWKCIAKEQRYCNN